jgi:hypothetical protein
MAIHGLIPSGDLLQHGRLNGGGAESLAARCQRRPSKQDETHRATACTIRAPPPLDEDTLQQGVLDADDIAGCAHVQATTVDGSTRAPTATRCPLASCCTADHGVVLPVTVWRCRSAGVHWSRPAKAVMLQRCWHEVSPWTLKGSIMYVRGTYMPISDTHDRQHM